MARGSKNKAKLIKVKPVDKGDKSHLMTYEESSTNASPDRREKRYHKISLLENAKKDIGADNDDVVSKEECEKYVKKVLNDAKIVEDMKIHVVNKMDTDNEDQISTAMTGDTNEPEKDGRKKKKTKKKKKKKNKKNDAEEIAKADTSEIKEEKEDIQQLEIAADTETNSNTRRKLPCIFGFIGTWLAKRKERRRAKKRKAIKERQSATPVQELVEYEHKRAKGGVAFTVEVDSRPMRLQVLPPIKKRTGQSMLGTEEKQKLVDEKRLLELEMKKKSAKEHEKRKTEYNERKSENEFYFKQKVDLTVRDKQFKAKKNRTRLQEDRRCPTPRLRAPSRLPPLRNPRVKPSADINDSDAQTVGTPKYENPVDNIFKF